MQDLALINKHCKLTERGAALSPGIRKGKPNPEHMSISGKLNHCTFLMNTILVDYLSDSKYLVTTLFEEWCPIKAQQ